MYFIKFDNCCHLLEMKLIIKTNEVSLGQYSDMIEAIYKRSCHNKQEKAGYWITNEYVIISLGNLIHMPI